MATVMNRAESVTDSDNGTMMFSEKKNIQMIA